MINNLALKHKTERAKIELDKKAALLIYELRYGKITRNDVKNEIASVSDDMRDYFKDALNRYRSAK